MSCPHKEIEEIEMKSNTKTTIAKKMCEIEVQTNSHKIYSMWVNRTKLLGSIDQQIDVDHEKNSEMRVSSRHKS